MFRVFIVIAFVCLYLGNAGAARAEPALVFDAGNKQVLLAQDAGAPWYPASLTKLMTAYVVFDAIRAGRLRLDQSIVMSKHAAKQPPSKVGYKPGTRFTVDFALRYLMVRSGNDIAVALAEATGGSESNFVARMNATARRLGMTGSRFANPHGLYNSKQVTTARDMGLLGAALYRDFPRYRKYFSLPYVKIGSKKLKNRNSLLRTMKGADGMKTGFICPAGFNLVASATRGGRHLIAVVMGRRSAHSRTKYTQILLEAAYQSGRRSKPVSLASIRNVGGTPRNMRASVCKGLGIRYAKPENLTGWGVSLGRTPGAANAFALLTAKSLVAGGYGKIGDSGVMRVPFEKDFIALKWAITNRQASQLCGFLKQIDAHCEVVNPQTLDTLKQDAIKYRQQLAAKKKARKTRKKKRRKRRKRRDPVR